MIRTPIGKALSLMVDTLARLDESRLP
jgi:hypothetical protein